MTWQPIETAPRDETRVMLFCQYDGICTAEWWQGEWLVYADKYQPAYDLDGKALKASAATHWQPLPEPPK